MQSEASDATFNQPESAPSEGDTAAPEEIPYCVYSVDLGAFLSNMGSANWAWTRNADEIAVWPTPQAAIKQVAYILDAHRDARIYRMDAETLGGE